MTPAEEADARAKIEPRLRQRAGASRGFQGDGDRASARDTRNGHQLRSSSTQPPQTSTLSLSTWPTRCSTSPGAIVDGNRLAFEECGAQWHTPAHILAGWR
jgi:hypothetical protein